MEEIICPEMTAQMVTVRPGVFPRPVPKNDSLYQI